MLQSCTLQSAMVKQRCKSPQQTRQNGVLSYVGSVVTLHLCRIKRPLPYTGEHCRSATRDRADLPGPFALSRIVALLQDRRNQRVSTTVLC